jgi:hypothetical protein
MFHPLILGILLFSTGVSWLIFRNSNQQISCCSSPDTTLTELLFGFDILSLCLMIFGCLFMLQGLTCSGDSKVKEGL